jgi:hypothetical protein
MADTPKSDTSEYSASKAPETRQHAENREPREFTDWRLIPGGKHGSPEPSGMNALHRSDVPSGADPSGLTKFDDILD